MITAVDTSVLLDLFAADPLHLHRSRAMLRRCAAEGGLVACDVVWAEVSSLFPSAEDAGVALDTAGITFSPLTQDAALLAGRHWGEYWRRGGPRPRAASDFLIGAHAVTHADRLLTRDRGFYRSYFERLTVLDPSAA